VTLTVHIDQETAMFWGLTLGKFLVLIIIGGMAGSWAARVVTLSKEGFGRWLNLGIGMIGALVGSGLFYLLHVDLGLGELKISVQDLVAAFAGSLLCILGWWIARMIWKKRAGKTTA
jgi:uncharacterized membrane protein YeaQ/YmgE (transglycosylase-associated protein family)